METKTCKTCGAAFSIEPGAVELYAKKDIPQPETCAKCRTKHLLSFWIFGKFRKTVSPLHGKSIITVIPESVPYPIYSREEWVSDGWDPMTYGVEYDGSRKFFDQLFDLHMKVPRPHQVGVNNVDCDWSDDTWDSKACYLCRSQGGCENLRYGYRNLQCKDSIDLAYCFNTDVSYDCLYCFKCYKVRHAFDSRDCIDSAFLYDCRNCQNCFMCWNLRNKQYCILNKQYSRDDYFNELKKYNLKSFSILESLKKQFKDLVAKEAIHKENLNTKIINSAGNFLSGCKNCRNSCFLEESENCYDTFRGFGSKDCTDAVGTYKNELAIMSCQETSNYDTFASAMSVGCRYSSYILNCEECEYCFGCVGLKKKKYCILNKQYAPESFDEIRTKIVEQMKKDGEWGQYFPMKFAGIGYNLSLAQLTYPETKENVLAMGGLWDDGEAQKAEGMPSSELPDNIDDVKDEISTQPIVCPETGMRYNIAAGELAFYRQNGIPLPRRHGDARTLERFGLIARMVESQEGRCCFCTKNITHYYRPELGYQKIACTDCYQKAVV